MTKLVAAGLISAIADDPDRHRYRQIHSSSEAMESVIGPQSSMMFSSALHHNTYIQRQKMNSVNSLKKLSSVNGSSHRFLC